MSPSRTMVVASPTETPLSSDQTLRAASALLHKIQTDDVNRKSSADKKSLLADADDQDAEDSTPVWLVLTTKKHVVDKKRLKPTKIGLPHPFHDLADKTLRICLITADPQRKYKDLIADPSFPVELGQRLQKVVGLEKLKARYKSYETRRQLFAEFDVFLADDRIITYLPKVLGKIFYKGGAKRPIPVTLEGRRQTKDEQGNKRRKLSEGGSKVVKDDIKPSDIAREIERALHCALVHLSPSTTTAVRVGDADMEATQLQANIAAVVRELVDKSVPQKWQNVRAIHIKGPNTAALPIWMTDELWADDKDVLEEAPAVKPSRKRTRALLEAGAEDEKSIEVPGPDGKMRTLVPSGKKAKSADSDVDVGAAVRMKARKELLKAQKLAAKQAVEQPLEASKTAKKTRTKTADLV